MIWANLVGYSHSTSKTEDWGIDSNSLASYPIDLAEDDYKDESLSIIIQLLSPAQQNEEVGM
jgi:hypothetical protein